MGDSIEFSSWLEQRVQHIEQVLDQILPPADNDSSLHAAMRYAVLGGGKRIRAILVYAAGLAAMQSTNISSAQHIALDYAAAAVELIHAYSLVHDDLPCMDDDTLRRGRPTVHIQFNEATAMLAADALQPLAFQMLAKMPVAPALIVQAIETLAHAAGSFGMVGGQAIDCDSVGVTLSAEQLRNMHSMKTGALLEASVLLGGIVVGAGSVTREGLERYATAVGLAFQVMDDILDATADTATLGKTAGKDAADHKPTYVTVLGLTASRELLASLSTQAHDALRPLGPTVTRLAGVADYIVGRNY